MTEPKTKRGVNTKERIITASQKCFFEKGYHGTSINDITREAGVANGTFYIYFDTKLSLYQYLIDEYGKRVRRNSSIAISEAATRKEAERLGIKNFFEFVLNDQSIFNIVWESLYIDKDLFDDFYTKFSQSYVKQIKAAQLDGAIRDIDPHVLSYILMGITNFVALNSIVLKQEKNIDHLVDEVMKVLENGIYN